MDESTRQTFGQLVRRYRLTGGHVTGKPLTIEELAEACGVVPATIKNCEKDNAKTGPKAELVDALAKTFKEHLAWTEQEYQAFVKAGKRPPPRTVSAPASTEGTPAATGEPGSSEGSPPATGDPRLTVRPRKIWLGAGEWRMQIGIVAILLLIATAAVALHAAAHQGTPPNPSAAPTISAAVQSTLPPPWPGNRVSEAQASTCAPFGCSVAHMKIWNFFQWNGQQVFGLENHPHCAYTAGPDVAVDIISCKPHLASAAHHHEYSVLVYMVTRGVHSTKPDVRTAYLEVDYYGDGRVTETQGATTSG